MTQQGKYLKIFERIVRSNLYLFVFSRYMVNKFFSNYIYESEFKILKILEKNFYFKNSKQPIIDVGANDGISYKSIRNFLKKKLIISFEPLVGKFSELKNLKKNDKNYKIYGFSGAVLFGESGKYYPESEKKCKIKKKEIESSIKSLFSNVKTRDESLAAVKGDPQAAIRNDTYFFLNNGDVWLQCYTYLKKNKEEDNVFDNLRVTILSKEFKKWINTKAY